MKASILILVGLVGIVHAIFVDDLFPFSQEHDARLSNGNFERSHQLALNIPVKFYNKEYDHLWIHTDGYVSFELADEDVFLGDFPFKSPLLAPFMLDLDTANHGNIFYRESNDIRVLARATEDIRLAFPFEASNFEAESALIVTWHEVEGRSLAGEIATFTFQCVLASNDRHTYAIFLYPENKMGVVTLTHKLKSAIFEARAGFNQGGEKYLEMYPVDDLANHKNTRRNGEWIFQIGGSKVEESGKISVPERRRHTKRQAPFINVQNINLEDEDDDNDDYIPVSTTPRSHDFCSRARVACTAENSECVNYERGYCCHCQGGYIGNGKACLVVDQPVRVNGNVSGVIDIRDESGAIERMSISGVEMHSYVITREGRAYTAISGVDPTLGRALQPMSAIGEAVAWLFSIPSPFALNGFQLTGGRFQRRVNIKYKEGGYRFSMTQRFLGVRKESNESVIIANTKFVGMLPSVPKDSAVKMKSYDEDYVKLSPGRYATNSSRTYTVGNQNYTFEITQDIIFSECRDSFSDFSDGMKYFVTEAFLNYHDTDNNVRYAIRSKISPKDESNGLSSDAPLNPCTEGTHGCHRNAECEPLEGQDFACRCRSGFAGDGTICDDFNECVQNPCRENALCFNEPGTYVCECVDGYTKNIETQDCELEAQSNPCDNVGDACGVGTCIPDGNSYRCECPDGYNFEEQNCEDVDECTNNLDNCADDARCTNTRGSFYCTCNPGFRGDGYSCEAVECPGNQVFSQCAGCFTTCEERSRPKICTLQCRVQCTCPSNTFLNGDMCVTAEECPSPTSDVPINPCDAADDLCGVGRCLPEGNSYRCECPVGFNFEERCIDVDECARNLDNCADDARCTNTRGSFYCTCNPGFRGDGYSCEAVECPGNQVFSQCAGCFTTCEERSRPKICTLQCRVQCTCPSNTFLNGDMCVTAEECPSPLPEISTNPCDAADDLCGVGRCLPDGNSYRCECPVGFNFRRGEKCADVNECARNLDNCADDARCTNTRGSFYCTCNPGFRGNGYNCEAVECPGNQVFSQCAGCFTTCEERSRPKICTLQCRVQCTCPSNTFLNGDMCVTAEECPSPPTIRPTNPCDAADDLCGVGRCLPEGNSYRCECPVGFSFRRGERCADVDECTNNLDNCADDARCTNTRGSFYCTCNSGFRGDGYSCEAVDCPGNQVFSQCAGCFTTCEERSRPKICTLQCRVQCTCPSNTFLNGDMCVTAEECPSQPGREMSRCELEASRKEAFIRDNSRIQDGPDIPLCMPDGSYSKRQCSGFTQSCWCVNPEFGTVVPNTLTERNPFGGIALDCDGAQPSASRPPRPQTECLKKYAQVELTHRRNPGLQDGPIYPDCDDDGLFVPKQCNGFALVCWCVDPQTGNVLPNTMTRLERLESFTCDVVQPSPSQPPPPPQTECLKQYAQVQLTHQRNPGLQDGPIYPDCDDGGLFVPKQCNGFTLVCWCVDPQTGNVLPNTMTRLERLESFTCDVVQPSPSQPPPPPQTECLKKYAQVELTHQRNPGLQDGPIYPDCDDDGLFVPKQCNGFTLVCWCVDPQTGNVLPNTMTQLERLESFTCDVVQPSPSPPPPPPQTECLKKYAQVELTHQRNPGLQDGPIYPDCDDDGLFVPKQCNGFTLVCWCVDPQTGNVLPDTMTQLERLESFTCDANRGEDEARLTPCQQQKSEAQEAQSRGGSARGPIFQPICTQAGAFEPIQYHPGGYYTCVDINGAEISRHRTEPQCLTQCQLQVYYAETENTLTGANNFIPQCKNDGSYSPVQCEFVTKTCYCVNQDGVEVEGTRISTKNVGLGGETDGVQVTIGCPQEVSVVTDPVSSQTEGTTTQTVLFQPTASTNVPVRLQSQPTTNQAIFAQSMHLNSVSLPITSSSASRQLYSGTGLVAVGVAFDCSSQNIYWTDVASRSIFMSPLADPNAATRIIKTNLISPEGVAVDFISGNIYWTDSGTDTIGVAKRDGSNIAVLISGGLSNPRGIAVDPIGGKVYWTDWNRKDPKIMVANLDGSQPTVLLRDGIRLPNDIVVDPFNRQLCFLDAGTKKIECMNLDGTGRAVKYDLTSSTIVSKPFALAVNGRMLYYTDRQANRLYVVDTVSKSKKSVEGPSGFRGHIYGVALTHPQCPLGRNRCSQNNGGCSHLCLPIPNGRTCKCPDMDSSCIEQ